MKLRVPCATCSVGRKPSELEFVLGELDDTGVIHVNCPQGHTTAVVLKARRYEVLLRSGGKALLSGFASESIASLAAALERAYEFYIRVVCRHRGIEDNQLKAAWKEVRTQSERQLGAFSFLYLIEQSEPLPLNPKIPEIRNRIVHQGRIAREDEALEFGRLVYARIRAIEHALVPLEPSAAAEAKDEIRVQEASVPRGMDHAALEIKTVMVKDGQALGRVNSFDDYLTALRQAMVKGMA